MSRKSNRITKAILETAKDMADGGIINQKDYKKITIRHLKKKIPVLEPMTSKEKSLKARIH